MYWKLGLAALLLIISICLLRFFRQPAVPTTTEISKETIEEDTIGESDEDSDSEESEQNVNQNENMSDEESEISDVESIEN